MALADELLDSISEEQFAEYMLVEENPHIVIDEDRNIILPERYKIIAAQGDHDMATYTFDCPRFSDGRDMSEMVVYINYIRSDGVPGSYPADNVTIDEQNANLMHFEWTLLLPATLEAGVLAFLVCVCKSGDDGKIENHWSSRMCREAMISEGMDCHADTIVDLYPDVITRILERLNILEGGGAASVQYTVQNLEEEQKVQARKNIEAADAKEVSKLSIEIGNLKYKQIEITRLSNNVGTVELGTVVNTVKLSWTLNKEPKSQKIDETAVDVSKRFKTLEDLAIGTNKNFKLEVTDERGAKDNASTSISFVNGVYYGVCQADDECTSEAILALTRKLQSSKGITFTVNAGAEQHIVFAMPSRYGTPNFNVGGFDGGFAKVSTFEFTNASGYTESYDVWVSDNSGLGDTTVKVS